MAGYFIRGSLPGNLRTRRLHASSSRTPFLVRPRDLPKLIALWPHELADESPEGRRFVLAKLRRALRAERRLGLAGHWSYDLNRHLGLLSAYKGEFAALNRSRREAQPNCTRRSKDADCG